MGSITNIVSLLAAGAGLISLGVTLVGAFFVVKAGGFQSANTAQSSAIGALQAEMGVKDKEIARLNRTVERLEQTIVTICVALKKRLGLIITVDDDMVSIEDRKGASTTARIRRISEDDDP